MKTFSITVARTALTWMLDLIKIADEQLYFFEHGKTLKQATKEARENLIKDLSGIYNVPAHDAKMQWSESKNKKEGVN